MQRLITLLICQFFLIQASLSQGGHVKEEWRQTWLQYSDAKKQMDKWQKEVKENAAIIRNLETNAEKDLTQIHELNKRQDELIRKLRKSQNDYLRICAEVKKANDSIKALKVQNKELTALVDSFASALKEEKTVSEQLLKEKKQLEKILYFKVKDLEIAEIENSYFTSFDIGYKKLLNNEIIYSENSKEQSTNPFLTSLEYLRYTGSVYTPAGIDTLEGFILIYKNDILSDQVPRRFVAEDTTISYCHFEISEKDVKLNSRIKSRSDIKIAFVIEEIFHMNREKLKNFNESYRSGLFVISSIRPETTSLTEDYYLKNTIIDDNEAFADTDTYTVNSEEIMIRLCTNGITASGEFVSLETGDTVMSNIKLVLFQNNPFTCALRLKEGVNLIKIKALSDSKTDTGCNLWVYTLGKDGEILRKKLKRLQKGELFGLYIRYDPKFL